MKIVWNLMVPYVLAYRAMQGWDERRGISLMPVIEAILWFMALGLAWIVDDGESPLLCPKWIAIVGPILIGVSYGHLFLAGRVAGWFVSGRTRGRS
jgi:hypothetical protein